MKAKVKATGEIINVEKEVSAIYYATNDGRLFWDIDLDLNLPEEKESSVIEGWVARDKDHRLMLHQVCPKRILFVDGFPPEEGSIDLPKNLFPSLTWESEPMRCKITITPIE